jgi:hypothetical protein
VVCDGRYASHDWQWVDGQHVCVDCCVVDLSGERLKREILDRLADKGIHVQGQRKRPPK